MTAFGRKSITHLGTLHGKGTLLIRDGRHLGQVIYEIDGYVDHGAKSANGQIEAESSMLDEAFVRTTQQSVWIAGAAFMLPCPILTAVLPLRSR